MLCAAELSQNMMVKLSRRLATSLSFGYFFAVRYFAYCFFGYFFGYFFWQKQFIPQRTQALATR